jgi:uncharacterized heparinase superfamily protein
MMQTQDTARFVRTAARLTPTQIVGRVRRRALAAELARSPAILRWVPPRNGGPYGPPSRWMIAPRRAATVGSDDQQVADLAVGILDLAGERIDTDAWSKWGHGGASMLARYHLHYLDWAWELAASETTPRDAVQRVLESWVVSHPVGCAVAWDPYPAARRAWNLCALDAEYDLLPEVPWLADLLDQHARSIRLLLERDLGGNHLIADIKALIGLAVWRGDRQSLTWAMQELDRALRDQVLADGGHEERSPAYHAQVLADLLDLQDLLVSSALPTPVFLRRAISEMRGWLAEIAAPDHSLPSFNDGDQVEPEIVERLLAGQRPSLASVRHLPASGFIVVRPVPSVHLVVEAGSPGPHRQPGHAHAGAGSFDLWVDGRRALRNLGSSTYDAGPRRDLERSTSGQNTLTLNDQDQSEVWGGFRVGASARVSAFVPGPAASTFFVEHDGFDSAGEPVIHRRTFHLTPDGLIVEDDLDGHGEAEVARRLHSTLAVSLDRDLTIVGPIRVRWVDAAEGSVTIRSERLATGLGRTEAGTTVSAADVVELPATFRCEIRWADR